MSFCRSRGRPCLGATRKSGSRKTGGGASSINPTSERWHGHNARTKKRATARITRLSTAIHTPPAKKQRSRPARRSWLSPHLGTLARVTHAEEKPHLLNPPPVGTPLPSMWASTDSSHRTGRRTRDWHGCTSAGAAYRSVRACRIVRRGQVFYRLWRNVPEGPRAQRRMPI